MISASRGWRATGARQLPAASPWLSVEGIGFVAQVAQHVAMILKLPGDDMDHVAVGIALDDAMHRHQPRAHDDLALPFEHVGPDHEIGDPRLVLEGDETTPLALPGRWRISTSPAIDSRLPSRMVLSRSAVMNFCAA